MYKYVNYTVIWNCKYTHTEKILKLANIVMMELLLTGECKVFDMPRFQNRKVPIK